MTTLFMSTGNTTTHLVFKSALFLAWMVLSAIYATGQQQHYHFNYAEEIRSDYSGLISLGKKESLRKDSLQHEGALSITKYNDSTLALLITTAIYKSSSKANKFEKEIALLVDLDVHKRVHRVRVTAASMPYVINSLAWLGEINLLKPAAGSVVESKIDGDYALTYQQNYTNGGIQLQKIHPKFVIAPQTTQTLVFTSYRHDSDFDPASQMVKALQFSEDKKQLLGRKTLACVRRKLLLTETAIPAYANSSRVPIAETDLIALELYKRASEEERRIRISRSLLGNSTLDDLLNESTMIDSLGTEARFRLKSKWRSLLLLDSGSFQAALQLWEQQPVGSALRTILQEALIETKRPAAYRFVSARIRSSAADYEVLKNLLFQISLASCFDSTVITDLTHLAATTKDDNIFNLVTLSLSNFALILKQRGDPDYFQITASLVKPYKTGSRDTLQYLYLTGNAGIESQAPEINKLLATNYRHEAMTALRNIHTAFADSLVYRYFIDEKEIAPTFYTTLLPGRQLTRAFVDDQSLKIIQSDKLGSDASLPALKFLLDNQYKEAIDISALLTYRFTTEVYKQEVEESEKAGSLCTRSY